VTDSLDTFTGFVDEAVLVQSTDGTMRLFLEGWILARGGPIIGLTFFLEEDAPQTAAKPLERPDVAFLNPSSTHALNSGFRVSLPISSTQKAIRIQFKAQLESGSLIRSAIDIRPSLSIPIIKSAEHIYDHGIRDSGRKREAKAPLPDYRGEFVAACMLRYKNFLLSGAQLALRRPRKITLSIIIPVAGQEHLTYACLETLSALKIPGMEVIIVDSSNSPETRELLSRFSGIKRIINRGKQNFSHACNLGAQRARGQFLLFLNNDAFPLPGAIEAAIKCYQDNPGSGAVGGKIIRPDGRIQEVGAFILPTGHTVSRGRGIPPDEAMYNVAVRVDYCSASFLLTSREVFSECGGFDERFDPAYYEDTDYCLRVTQAGYPCVVEPRAIVLHLERGTTDSNYDIDSLMSESLRVFKKLHPEFNHRLGSHDERQYLSATQHDVYPQPSHTDATTPTSILVIDDTVPDAMQGQGQGRSALILKTLGELSVPVSWYPVFDESGPQGKCPPGVEIIRPAQDEERICFMRRILANFDTVLVSRPHHMEQLQIALRSLPPLAKIPRVVYDAEAVQGTREILRFELKNQLILSEEEIETILSNEVILARDADRILAASSLEASTFVDFGFSQPVILSYGITPQPTSALFHERSHFLTVGPMLERDTPNSDAVCWFLESILPHIVSLLQTSKVALHCVGDCQVQEISAKQGIHFKLLGQIRDMQPVYSRYRVMVAPTRFSAGIPLKVIEAASYGVPSVVTPAIARQLDWEDECELLVGYDNVDFAAKCAALYQDQTLWERIRKAALGRVAQQFSIPEFKRSLSVSLLAR
jgi:GT2 family glycosyltransferase/glycosyltransferase involved in cell wall biosynthesis